MKRIAFFLFTVFLVLSGHLSAQIIHCLWEPKPITIDGSPEDWPQPFNYYDGNTKLQFTFANDTANIYVCLKITDDPTQLRLFNGGLGIWIDPKGKKKETMGISFPLKGETNQGAGSAVGGRHKKPGGVESEPDPSAQKSDALRLKQHAFLTQTTLRVKGFIGLPEQVLPLKNDFGLNVAFNWDSLNILTIEYKFPIAMVLGHAITPADTLKPISVAFIEPALEGIKMPSQENEDNSITNPAGQNGQYGNRGMNGGMNNGMGSMNGRGGMGGGGGGHNSMPVQNPANQEQKLWSKVILVLSQGDRYY